MRIEDVIISGLMIDQEYARKSIPHLSGAYFQERADAVLFEEVSAFFLKYNELPTKEIIRVQLGQRIGVSDGDLETQLERLSAYSVERKQLDWMLERTEKFCKDKAVFNAIMQAITILDGKDKQHNKEAIPNILQQALAVQFDTAVGHSYIDDAEARYDFYSKTEERIPFDIDILNEVTSGGLTRKSLTLIAAQSGGGKSLAMTHMAAAALKNGLNVLYITLEMAEERIAERIDANLLDVEVNKIATLGKDVFCTKIHNIAAKTHGRLFIKEYPTGGAHSGHFRGLLEELKTKQNFNADIIFIDYLGICASARVKMGGSINSYGYLKAIAEELRGLSIEYNAPVVTGAQLNRGGFDSSDVSLTDTADSAGIIHAADLMLALIRTEELDAMGKIMIKQLKNRYSDPGVMTRFLVGIDRSKMKLFDDDEARTLKPDAVAALKSYTPVVRKTETVALSEDVIMNLPIAGKKPQLQGGDFVF